MPSYRWRETAVVLIYSMGYPFSFMRMPREGVLGRYRPMRHAVVAVGVVGRDVAFITPENVNLVPRQLCPK
jgi:hypothetical protein